MGVLSGNCYPEDNRLANLSNPQVKAESHPRREGLADGVDSGASHQVAPIQKVLNGCIDLHPRANPSARGQVDEQEPRHWELIEIVFELRAHESDLHRRHQERWEVEGQPEV